ncbi:MAG: hypothetical protein WD382_02130 [Halofilum sp. (in: g-proteobacteria)]
MLAALVERSNKPRFRPPPLRQCHAQGLSGHVRQHLPIDGPPEELARVQVEDHRQITQPVAVGTYVMSAGLVRLNRRILAIEMVLGDNGTFVLTAAGRARASACAR